MEYGPVLGDDHQKYQISSSVAAPIIPKLPKYIILRSFANHEYLRYIDEPDSYVSHLEFSGGNPRDKKSYTFSPKGKFEVEPAAKFSDRGYVHIKSCYNYKYWECRAETNHITATASKPVEDETDNACTLFRPIYENLVSEQHKILRLLHVSSKKFLTARSSGRHHYLLQAGFDSKDSIIFRDLIAIIDWKTILVLPKRIVFKGQNGKYLKAYRGSYNYMAYQSENKHEEVVANEITQRPNGTVSIRNIHFDKFWRSNDDSGGWIYVNADSDETAGVHFKPIALENNNKIALQSLHNQKFCTYDPIDDSTCCLSATSDVINQNSHMTIEEAVVSRVIDNVKYRLLDARMFDVTSASAKPAYIENNTNSPTMKYTRAITLAASNTSSWNYMSGLKLGVSATLEAGVPTILDGQVTISAEIGKSYKWGGVDKEETEIGGKLIASVPPMSKLTVNLTFTKGTCEVPFSYVQHDTLTDGVSETTEMEDGIYTGNNCYSFMFETIETAL